MVVALAIVFKPYRLARIVGFLDKDYTIVDTIDKSGRFKAYVRSSLATRDPSYQAKQSRIAVGSGGALGVGLAQGKQKLLYLPEAHTDFISAIIGEELGFVGVGVLIIAFVLVTVQGLRAAMNAADEYGTYLALGITTFIGLQAFTNLGVAMGMLPTKGLVLPFISYGGSSLIVNCAAMGVLLNVSRKREITLAKEPTAEPVVAQGNRNLIRSTRHPVAGGAA